MAEMKESKVIIDKLKADQQVIIDAAQAKMTEIEGLVPAIEADILAAETAILESVGQANGDDKLYSDKEWNDRELEFKTAQEEKDTKLAEMGAKLDEAMPMVDAAKAEAKTATERLATAKKAYAAQQEAETASESVESIFGKEDSVSEQPLPAPTPEESQP